MAKTMKRKKSKIRRPGQSKAQADSSGSVLHAFRTSKSDGITQYMREMQNKSEFIVEAIREHLRRKVSVDCPRCKGAGKILKRRKPYLKKPVG